MPGMMDTVLNLGLNDATVAGPRRGGRATRASPGTAIAASSRCTAPSCSASSTTGSRRSSSTPSWTTGVIEDTALTRRGLAARRRRLQGRWCAEETGKPFPQDPQEQLWGAIGAVFGSWMNPRAITYRRLHDIPADWGTAVNVQAMVFGNMGEDCATGVCFTRDPSTGENMFYGEYLVNAQGEDVVAGIRTPQPMSERARQAGRGAAWKQAMPAAYRRAAGRARHAGAALPRHAGHRVHRAAEQAVHAADAQRQAHRRGQPAHRRRDGARGADRPEGGGAAGQPGGARPVAAPDARSRRRRARCWPRACRPAPARPPAPSCSAPTRPKAAPPRARR